MLPSAALLAALLALTGSAFGQSSWNYLQHGDDWGPSCRSGSQQSPIDIEIDRLAEVRGEPLYFINYQRSTPVRVQVDAAHYTIKITPTADYKLSISGGGLPGNYVLDSLHFHWPSEHTIDGHRGLLEAHFVHRKDIYNSTTEAAKDPEGIAVIGIIYTCKRPWKVSYLKYLKKKLKGYKYNGLKGRGIFIPKPWNHFKTFKKEGKDNHELFKIESAAREGEQTYLNFEHMLPYDKSEFYRYKGSLTTPTCAESVVWTIFKNYVHASPLQVAAFRGLLPVKDQTVDTYRNVQPLNDRVVESWITSGKPELNKVDHFHPNPSLLFAVIPGLSNSIQFPHFLRKFV